ncbi:MAG: phosphoribosylanthranilate isomerase [Candidatus Freyarchaeota archaeon]
MSPVRVKICGITSARDLQAAADAGADAVGLIVNVPNSPRNLTLSKARIIAKKTPPFVETVIVTLPHSISHLEKIHSKLKPSTIQVHGLTKALTTAIRAAETLDAVLLDTPAQNEHGGTGLTHDWSLSGKVREAIHPKPLILAGGLKPENVAEAVKLVKPYAVDASSGVEARPGVKDHKKMVEFVRKAKEANTC